DERSAQVLRYVDLPEVQIVARQRERSQAGEHHGRDHDSVGTALEIPCQLLDSEDDTCEWRIEGCRESRRRTGEQEPAFELRAAVRIEAPDFRHDRRANVYRRPLAPYREAAQQADQRNADLSNDHA